ncbi:unnamed protein product, partial [Rotaria sordida]
MYPHLQSQSFHKPAEKNMAGFEEFVRQYNINETFATKLRDLRGYEIVFICDDSGSMNAPIGPVSDSGRQPSTR